jgi:hypothetical protein
MVNKSGTKLMHDPTDLEKKSLEAHVDLCAQRYRFLESKLQAVEEKISDLNTTIGEVHDMLFDMSEKRSDQLMGWGVGIIVSLIGIVGYLLATYVL